MTSPQTDQDPKPAPYPVPREYYRDPRLKFPLAAGIMSLMPGLGQVYLGYTQLGFIHAGTAAVLVGLMSSNRLGGLEPVVGVFMFFFWLYNLVDAYRRATLLNEAILRMETPELPDGMQAIPFQGRIAAGLILMAAGTLSLLSLRFGISMEWLVRWWPLGLVLLGFYLVLRAIQDRKAAQD